MKRRNVRRRQVNAWLRRELRARPYGHVPPCVLREYGRVAGRKNVIGA